jgi:hypothetical protein
MDEDELALYFAAKKENEELKIELSILKTKITTLTKFSANIEKELFSNDDEMKRLQGHINGMRLATTSLTQSYDRMLSFIKLLDDHPMFWGSSYKRSIMQFLHDRFPEK